MMQAAAEPFGIVPSLEVLPLYATEDLPVLLRPYSSYGEISRNLLTRKLSGGIIPWEIFIADVLALPGQRACWKVLLFLHACPTELVLREAVYKTFYPLSGSHRGKLPARLTVGVESQNSLTKAQSREWLGHWQDGRDVQLDFRMLPMDLMIQALAAEALDAIIAPSPWGIHAETSGLGRRDPRFSPGKFAQQLVLVCHREFLEAHAGLPRSLSRGIATARVRLQDAAAFAQAISHMVKCGKSAAGAGSLEQAALLHSFTSLDRDVVPDLHKLVAELMSLEDFSILPAQVAAGEQTARLLLPA